MRHGDESAHIKADFWAWPRKRPVSHKRHREMLDESHLGEDLIRLGIIL
jgi:hypothetical protein